MALKMYPNHISPIYVIFLAVASVMAAVSTVCVVFRSIQRFSMKFMWDDYYILGSLILAFGFVIMTILLADTIPHAGYHTNGCTVTEINTHLKAYSQIKLQRVANELL